MKIGHGYKLFEMNSEGKIFPLFIGKTKETPMQEWVPAEIINHHPSFSHRPGWHLGEVPAAPWLMSVDGTYKSQRSKKWKRVWAEVEYVADCDYTDFVAQTKEKCMKYTTPTNGYYFFKEAGLNRIWIIAGQIKVVRILSENERQEILKDMEYNEEEMFAPYKASIEKRMRNRKGK